MTDEQPKDYPSPKGRLAEDWGDVAAKGVLGMSNAQKGWILAFVVIFGVFQATNYAANVARESADVERADRLAKYFETVEMNRAKVEEHRSQELRRAQETIEALADTIGRQSERQARMEREATVIDKTIERAR